MGLVSAPRPLISVVVPVYNAEPYLADTVHSILAQTYTHFELITVDDGSTDASRCILEDFAGRDPRIRPVFLSHGGQSHALNAGVALARGDFIAHMDHDDVALPHRLEVQLGWMIEQGADLCGGWLKKFGDQDGFFWFPVRHEDICIELLFRVALHHGTSLVRAEIAKAHLFDERARLTDYEMLTRLAPRCRMSNVPQILLKHRRHARQAQVVYRADFLSDLRTYRRRHFDNLFPEATEEDYTAVARVADRESFPTMEELEHAGEWLIRLSKTPDAFLRHRMARRWLGACLGSAHLGPACYRLYRAMGQRFDVPSLDQAHRLRLACYARIRSGSRTFTVAAAIRRAIVGKKAGKRRDAGRGSNADPNLFHGPGSAGKPSEE